MFKGSRTNVKHFRHIGDAESAATEWKQSLSGIHEIIETAAAFANTEGGRPRGCALGGMRNLGGFIVNLLVGNNEERS